MLQPHSDMNSGGRGMTNHRDHTEAKDNDHTIFGGVLRFIRFLVPHLILLGVFFLYLVVGAVIFSKIESPQSDATVYKTEMKKAKTDLFEFVTNISAKASPMPQTVDSPTKEKDYPTPGDIDLTEPYSTVKFDGKTDEDKIGKKIDEIMEKMSRPEWKIGRMDSIQAGRAWTFPSAMLFCMTTITTIGYGDVVPMTMWGRAFCIIYAIIGIPLSLLCLASIGNLLARLTLKICRFLHIKIYLRGGVRVGNCSTCLSLSKGGNKFKKSRQTSSRRGIANAETVEVVMAEIGKSTKFPTKVAEAKQDEYKQGKHGMTNSGLDDFSIEHPYIRSVSIATERPTSHPHGVTSKQSSTDVPEPCECVHQGKQTVDVLEEVPLLIVIIILIGYILAGAAMMSASEGWPYGTGVYFMFITLTTIGFGDILPINHYTRDAFVPCIFFTLFGLAVMSMSIALVQAKVIRAFKLISMKLNIC